MRARKLTLIMDGNFNFYQGEVYSPHMHFDAFLGRFCALFSEVLLVARAFPKNKAIGDKVVAANCQFYSLGSYRGAWALVRSLPTLIYRLVGVIRTSDIILIRFPGNLAILSLLLCVLLRKKFSVEVVADPEDYFSAGASNLRFRQPVRFAHVLFTRVACSLALTVRYVTTQYLQTKYPAARGAPTYGFSDVYIPAVNVAERKSSPARVVFVNVGMMHNLSKGHMVLFEALKYISEHVECDFECILVGDGHLRSFFEGRVREMGIQDSVTFLGVMAPSSRVWEVVAGADIFVMPSFQEGMPRALIEAMALGLACAATDVGGIPEILPDRCLVPVGDAEELAGLLSSWMTNPRIRQSVASECLEMAKQFSLEVMNNMTKEYFERLKSVHG